MALTFNPCLGFVYEAPLSWCQNLCLAKVSSYYHLPAAAIVELDSQAHRTTTIKCSMDRGRQREEMSQKTTATVTSKWMTVDSTMAMIWSDVMLLVITVHACLVVLWQVTHLRVSLCVCQQVSHETLDKSFCNRTIEYRFLVLPHWTLSIVLIDIKGKTFIFCFVE